MTVLHVAGHIAYLVAWSVLWAWVVISGLVVLAVANAIVQEHRQKRRDRRARLAAKLRDHAERGSCSGCADAPRRLRDVMWTDADDAMVAELLGGNA